MRITKKQILDALGIGWPVSKDELTVALLEVESVLESVSADLEDEDDFKSAVIGDTSNLVQLIRENL